jgi:leucyl-tRNA synthetase
MYEMFMGPLEAVKPWNTKGVEGLQRFLKRAWRMIVGEDGHVAAEIADGVEMNDEQQRLLHATIKKVTDDLENMDFNTAISQLMIFVNEFSRLETRNRAAMETFVLLLAPFAPHAAEELWQRLGHERTLAYEPWPDYDEARLEVAEVEILVQLNGRPKVRLNVPADADSAALEEIVMNTDEVRELLADKTVIKVIAVPGRLVNVVAR